MAAQIACNASAASNLTPTEAHVWESAQTLWAMLARMPERREAPTTGEGARMHMVLLATH